MSAERSGRDPDEPASGTPPVGSAAPSLSRVDARADLERTLLALLPRVRGWLYRALGPSGPLEDATQDALIELAHALGRFEGRSSVETFAHRVTVRVAYRYYARRAPERELDHDLIASDTRLPDELLVERQALARLHRCLAKLPERRRTAFVLCAIEGLSPQEAAALVGTSAGSMRSRYMHARAELARLLGERAGDRS